MTTIRRWHSYFGFFMAPIVLFFALTGAAQLFSLHEAHGNYQPPALLEKLSSVHKDQVFAPGHHHGPPAEGTAALATTGDDDDKTSPSTLALKAFFLLVALCLVLSTALGLWMGLTQTRQKRLGWVLVVAGALIPLGLLLL
jgi:hypothetical protein